MSYNSQAVGTQGSKLEIGNGDSPLSYTEVKEIKQFNGFDGQAAVIDVTHLQSAAKEKRMGLQDWGGFSMDTNYLANDTGQGLMRAAKGNGELQDFRFTDRNGDTAIFQAFVLSAPISGGVDAVLEGSFALEITGDVTFA